MKRLWTRLLVTTAIAACGGWVGVAAGAAFLVHVGWTAAELLDGGDTARRVVTAAGRMGGTR